MYKLHCGHEVAMLSGRSGVDNDIFPLVAGSVAELYIEPMLPCISDVDVMTSRRSQLAIPRGHSPPTQLPAEFDNYVKVHEITDSILPGDVYIVPRVTLLTDKVH